MLLNIFLITQIKGEGPGLLPKSYHPYRTSDSRVIPLLTLLICLYQLKQRDGLPNSSKRTQSDFSNQPDYNHDSKHKTLSMDWSNLVIHPKFIQT